MSPTSAVLTEHTQSAVPAQVSGQLTSSHRMPFGAEVQLDGSVRFRVWAPAAQTLQVKLEGQGEPLTLTRNEDGWHEIVTDHAHVGSLYEFVLPDGTLVPDPASRFQPRDVKGPSEVIAPGSYLWKDGDWKGRPWEETVLYELHVGTFTWRGTFLSAVEKFDQLAELGITAIEIMPIADFAGARNWGYDGVLLFAPDSCYGRPEDLKSLVEAAHTRGMMVILDVVYNHFGPDGNFLPMYAPQVFTSCHKTPWGDAVNYDQKGSEVVREFVIQNALYWIEEFHLDGLRLDAVHQIKDDSPKHLLDELAERVRSLQLSRPIHLILENEANEASRLRRDDEGQPAEYTAQWNDDVHHVLHTAATEENQGYYADYVRDTEKLGRALAEGFAFQGELMKCAGKNRGEPSVHLPTTAFVAFMQNHDQVGNRAFGERICQISSAQAVRATAAVYLLLPQIPMIFMGEEWECSQPFPFFCDFDGELGDLVRKGRREEFASFPEFQDPAQRERIPDPQALETFQSAKLRWEVAGEGFHAESLAWYKSILAVRRERIVPLLKEPLFGGTYKVLGEGAVFVSWKTAGGKFLTLAANLSKHANESFPEVKGSTIWREGIEQEGSRAESWSVRWALSNEP